MFWYAICSFGRSEKMKKKVIRLSKIVISVLLMTYMLSRINYSEIRNIFNQLNASVIITTIIFYLVSVIFNAVKWHVLLPETSLGFLVFLCFRSQLYSTVLPGQLFGEASKIMHWESQKTETIKVSASILFDKITGIIGQAFIAIIGLFFSSVGRKTGNTHWFAILGIVFLLVIFISSESHVADVINRVLIGVSKKLKMLGEKCSKFYSAWCFFSTNRKIMFKSILWGMFNQFIGIAIAWYISFSLKLNVPFMDYCWIMPVLSLILLLPISFAGIGLRDASMASLLLLYGVSAGNAVVISSIMLLGQIMASVVGGIMILFFNVGEKSDYDIK